MANAQELLQSLMRSGQVPDAASLLSDIQALTKGQSASQVRAESESRRPKTENRKASTEGNSTGEITDESGLFSLNRNLKARVDERFSPEEQLEIFGDQTPSDKQMWRALNGATAAQAGITPGFQSEPILGGIFGGSEEFAIRKQLGERQRELDKTLDRVKEKALLKDLERGQDLTQAKSVLGETQGQIPKRLIGELLADGLLQTFGQPEGPPVASGFLVNEIQDRTDPRALELGGEGVDRVFAPVATPSLDRGLIPQIVPDAPISEQALRIGAASLATDLATQKPQIPVGSNEALERRKQFDIVRKSQADIDNTRSLILERKEAGKAVQERLKTMEAQSNLDKAKLEDKRRMDTLRIANGLLEKTDLTGEQILEVLFNIMETTNPDQPRIRLKDRDFIKGILSQFNLGDKPESPKLFGERTAEEVEVVLPKESPEELRRREEDARQRAN